jgi:hypothetical protein
VSAWGAVYAVAALAYPDFIRDRAQAVLGENANGVGLLCGLGVVAAASAFVAKRGTWWWTLPTVGLCLLGTAATGSRGAVLACAAGIVAIFLKSRFEGPALKAVSWAILVGGSFYLLAGPLLRWFVQFSGRGEVGSQNVDVRRESLIFAIHTGLENPLTGVGLGRLSLVSADDPESRLGLAAHNAFAGMFAESGVLTLALMGLVSVWALNQARNSAASGDFALLVAVLTAAVSFDWWGTAHVGVLAMLLIGRCLGLPRSAGSPQEDERTCGCDPRDRRAAASRSEDRQRLRSRYAETRTGCYPSVGPRSRPSWS